MPTLDLPADGEQPWGAKLRTAIEELNIPVDDLLALLAGGTTGQVFTKDTDDDYAASWQDPAAGVTGTGIDHIEAITRTAYDALVTPDATTLYVIDESA